MHFGEGATRCQIQEFEEEFDAVVRSLGGDPRQRDIKCAFCKESVTGTFTICGHGYCQKCMISQVDNCISQGMFCGQCVTPIHIKDIKSVLAPKQFSKLCTETVVAKIMQKPSDFDVRACPNKCGALLSYLHHVQLCTSCDAHVCTDCDIVCAPMTEEEKRRLDREEARLSQEDALLEAMLEGRDDRIDVILKLDARVQALALNGEDYIKSNWPFSVGKIEHIDVNPGMQARCQAYERFMQTVSKGLGTIENGFFAWYGVTESEIGGICDGGFDPKRRSQ